jgi:hypothetical protein
MNVGVWMAGGAMSGGGSMTVVPLERGGQGGSNGVKIRMIVAVLSEI